MVSSRPEFGPIVPAPSSDEAAAVIAAVERFLRDRALALVALGEAPDPWYRQGLIEATGRENSEPSPWGDPIAWGA